MSRINTNVPSLLARRVLGQQNRGLVTSLERLSTGLRINRGSDDPAGLIASENLRAEKKAINAAIGNAERAEAGHQHCRGRSPGDQQPAPRAPVARRPVGQRSWCLQRGEGSESAPDRLHPADDRPSRKCHELQRHQAAERQLRLHDVRRELHSEISDVTVNSARLPDSTGANIAVTVDVTSPLRPLASTSQRGPRSTTAATGRSPSKSPATRGCSNSPSPPVQRRPMSSTPSTPSVRCRSASLR